MPQLCHPLTSGFPKSSKRLREPHLYTKIAETPSDSKSLTYTKSAETPSDSESLTYTKNHKEWRAQSSFLEALQRRIAHDLQHAEVMSHAIRFLCRTFQIRHEHAALEVQAGVVEVGLRAGLLRLRLRLGRLGRRGHARRSRRPGHPVFSGLGRSFCNGRVQPPCKA